MIKIIQSNFEKEIKKNTPAYSASEKSVQKIIEEVKKYGDRAVVKFTQRFDRVRISPANFEIPRGQWLKDSAKIPARAKKILQAAAKNIFDFHKKEIPRSWLFKKNGKITGRRFAPIEKVGIYVPGGRALYPSTVLMNSIPAKIAGVKEIVMVTPPDKNGKISPLLLYAALLAGVTRIFKIGGAQAVAGLAFGTRYLPRVDKIVGPGNIFVTLAKKNLFGQIGLDGLAGPSELLILAEAGINPYFVAADLLSQAEHDPQARVFLVTESQKLAAAVNPALIKLFKITRRQKIISAALKNARIFLVKNLKSAYALINQIAPEHLEIMVKRPDLALAAIKNAGAIFIGPYTPTASGDYTAGPSHTLPTSGTARFASGLGVADFMKSSSVIYYSPKALQKEASVIEQLALLEGFDAHALSLVVRRVAV